MADIGLFGGTFDPVHRGHIQCAAAALEEAGIDNVIFIPAARPPHKDGENICNFNHRMAMLKMAIMPFEDFSISDLERKRAYPSYTIDTLREFQNNVDISSTYHFIIGGDAFLEIESWHCWQTVIAQVDFVIIVRPGYYRSDLYNLLHRHEFLKSTIQNNVWNNLKGNNKIQLLATETEDISSTDIRRRIRKNLPWNHLVADRVWEYIKRQSLYI